MMLYEVALVEDRGSYWTVTGVTENSFTTVDQESRYLKLSAVSAKIIKDAILDSNEVRISKPLLAMEVLPNEVKVIKHEKDDVDMFKQSQLKRVRMLINPVMASMSGFAFYRFICLNNELADKGYFITDENRESKYLAILESGDEKMIMKLEDYLNSRDEISKVNSLNKKFEEHFKKVMQETNNEMVTKLTDEFMDDFYSRF